MDWIDQEHTRRAAGHLKSLLQSEHAAVNARHPGCTLEYCCACGEPTGRAGRGDDSLYTDEGEGPYCSDCWDLEKQTPDLVDPRKERAPGRTYRTAKPMRIFHCFHFPAPYSQPTQRRLGPSTPLIRSVGLSRSRWAYFSPHNKAREYHDQEEKRLGATLVPQK